LPKVMTHEVYSVRAAEKNRRHLNSLTEWRLTGGASAASEEAKAMSESAARAC